MNVEYINPPTEPAVSLTAFAEKHGLTLQVRKELKQRVAFPFGRSYQRYCVRFKSVVVVQRYETNIPEPHGYGSTLERAAEEYVRIIAGREIYWYAGSERIRVTVPKTLYNDWSGDDAQKPYYNIINPPFKEPTAE